jgi:predicted enzyme related to lactoylglutathione lyase
VIPVENMARAKKFYEHVMDVQLVPGDPMDGREVALLPYEITCVIRRQ